MSTFPSKPDAGKSFTPPKESGLRVAAKALGWMIGSALFALALLTATISFLLNSERVHSYILSVAEREAEQELGVKVSLLNFTLHPSTLSLDLWGLTVSGASPYDGVPLLQVDHAEAGAGIASVLHGKWYLSSIVIDRPIVHIYVDNNGVSNIPVFNTKAKSSNSTSMFDLGVRHAILDRGEIYYNDRHSALDADLHNLELRSAFNSSEQQYSGSLEYSNGHLVSGSLKPIPHDLIAHFDITRRTFHLRDAKLTSGSSNIALRATIENYKSPSVTAHYDAMLNGAQFQQILRSSSVPAGVINVSGDASYIADTGRPLIDALEMSGSITSKELDLHSPSIRAQVNRLAGQYTLSNGDLSLHDFRAQLLGGTVLADGRMSNLGGNTHSDSRVELQGISLEQLRNLSASGASASDIALKGILNARVQASWGKTLQGLVANVDATIEGSFSRRTPQKDQSSLENVPIQSVIHATYDAQAQRIDLGKSYARTPKTDLTLEGVLGTRSSLTIRLQADDLHEEEMIVDAFRTPAGGKPIQQVGLRGTASFQGTVQGTTLAPHLQGQFIASNFHLNGTEWKRLRTDIDGGPSHISIQHADLEPVSKGHIRIDASAALSKWKFIKTSQVEVAVDAAQLDISQLTKLAGQQVPVSGMLSANLRMHGTQLNPQGSGKVSLTSVSAYEQPIQRVNLDVSGNGEQVKGTIKMSLPTGLVQGEVTVHPKIRTYSAQLSAVGIQLDKLQVLKARNVNAIGVLSMNATGHGSFYDPNVDATLQIPQLVIQNQTINGINFHAAISNHIGSAALVASAINTSIHASAKVNLSGDYLADASLDTQAIPLQPLFATYIPSQAQQLSGQTEIHAILHGPLKKKNLLEAHVQIPILNLNFGKTVQLAETSPIRVDLKNGLVTIQRSGIQGTDTNLQFQGSIPTAGNEPMSLMLTGNVNLELAELFQPDIHSSGQLKFNINSSGTVTASDLGGEIDIVDANYASGGLPVGLSHGNGVLKLTKSRINISSFEGSVGGGTLTAQGGLAYSPNLQFDLGLKAEGIRMLYPQGVRERVDADVRLAGTEENSVLGGTVNLSELSFTPAFDLNTLIGQRSGGVSGPPAPGLAQNIQLNLAVRSSNDVNLVSRTLSVGGSANLQVRGTAANPVILGRVNLNNGDIILNGNRFVLSGGTIQFVNPSETQPVVNVSLNTNIQQYNIFLRFNGPVSQLRTDYSSDPALPAADIINLLAFGQTTEASAANPSTPANQEAESLVASQVSSQVTSRFAKIAGISQLSISPVLGGSSNQGNPGANITIQQRVTGNLFVTFTSNVGSTQSQTIQGQYQLSPKVAVSATRDQSGGVAFDMLIKKSW